MDKKSRDLILTSVNKIIELAFDITNDETNGIKVTVEYGSYKNSLHIKIYADGSSNPESIIITGTLYFTGNLQKLSFYNTPIFISKLEDIRNTGKIYLDKLFKFGCYYSFFEIWGAYLWILEKYWKKSLVN